MPFPQDHARVLLETARATIRTALGGQIPPPPLLDGHPPELMRPAGCFVSLHELDSRRLRGCVGRLEARAPLLLAVHDAAISVLCDPRFTDDPVRADHLPLLDLELTVLSKLLLAEHCLDFDLLTHGIYLAVDGRCGCFLPQVARETGWSREQLLARLCTEKLDLPADAWQHPAATLHRFSVEIIGPEPFEPVPSSEC